MTSGAVGFSPAAVLARQALDRPTTVKPADVEARETFDQFVGETFVGQMLSALRKTTGKAAYFHGGRAEEVFREQLDQTLAKELGQDLAHSFTGPMFDLFYQQRL